MRLLLSIESWVDIKNIIFSSNAGDALKITKNI